MVLLDKTFNCAIFYYTHHSFESPLIVTRIFAAPQGCRSPKWSWNACRRSRWQAAPGPASAGVSVDPRCHPPSLHPFPPGAQEMEGGVAGEVGGLDQDLWPDLWRTLRTAVMVQLLCRQLVSTSFGDASALLAVPETTSSLSPHQTPSWELSWRARFWEQPLVFGG